MENFKPDLAESFLADFNAARIMEIHTAMGALGFTFTMGGPEGENQVVYEGKRADGTTIRIVFKKGENYKTPKEISDEIEKEAAIKKAQEDFDRR